MQGERNALSGEQAALSKVPAVTLGFWAIKILATTLGETAGDAASMSLGLGYLASTAIFMTFFVAAVAGQIRIDRYHPLLYWTTLIASTTVGTTLADLADRSLGVGYLGGSIALSAAVATSLWLWYRTLGTVEVASVSTPRSEMFYWTTIMFSQTLGTALGDWTADTAGLGYAGAVCIFGGALVLTALAYYTTRLPRSQLFWSAFVLTRPLGAVIGDFIDKPLAEGGMNLSRFGASAILLFSIVCCVLVFSREPARLQR